jgi:hypothetical protein
MKIYHFSKEKKGPKQIVFFGAKSHQISTWKIWFCLIQINFHGKKTQIRQISKKKFTNHQISMISSGR